jgi:hypothetical protein
MPDLVAELAEKVRTLAPEDRSRLVGLLLESLHESPLAEVEAAWESEAISEEKNNATIREGLPFSRGNRISVRGARARIIRRIEARQFAPLLFTRRKTDS